MADPKVIIRAGDPVIESIKTEYGHDYAVWFEMSEGVQATVYLDHNITDVIILTDLRDTYTCPEYDDEVRSAIAVLIKQVWANNKHDAKKKLAAFDRELEANRANKE
jgi:hypothetical protein